MDRSRPRTDQGFTLLELLVVLAIIGILAAIAVPQLAAYQRRSLDADIKTTVKNAATFEEAYFTDQNSYTSTLAGLTSKGFKQSAGVTIELSVTVADFVITGAAVAGCGGSTGIWSFDSTKGTLTGTPCS